MKKISLFLSIALLVSNTIYAQIITIPDVNFKNALVNDSVVDTDGDGAGDSDADTNNNGEIEVSEAQAIIGLEIPNKNIESFEGIEHFTSLENFVGFSNPIGTIDLSENALLTEVNLVSCQLTAIDLSNNSMLEYVYVSENELNSLDVTNNPDLLWLECQSNNIRNINLSQNVKLERLHCNDNELQLLNLSINEGLQHIFAYNNQLVFVGINAPESLTELRLENNLITNLDLSTHVALTNLWVHNNALVALNIQNGNNILLESFLADSNPSLACIQVDDVEFANQQTNWFKDDTAQYNEDCSLGLNNASIISSIILYPNPTKDILNMVTENIPVKLVKIYTMQGQLVTTSKTTNNLDVSGLNQGVYIIEVLLETNDFTIKQFVKK